MGSLVDTESSITHVGMSNDLFIRDLYPTENLPEAPHRGTLMKREVRPPLNCVKEDQSLSL